MVLYSQDTTEEAAALSYFENVINKDRIVVVVLHRNCLGNIVLTKYKLRQMHQANQSFRILGMHMGMDCTVVRSQTSWV